MDFELAHNSLCSNIYLKPEARHQWQQHGCAHCCSRRHALLQKQALHVSGRTNSSPCLTVEAKWEILRDSSITCTQKQQNNVWFAWKWRLRCWPFLPKSWGPVALSGKLGLSMGRIGHKLLDAALHRTTFPVLKPLIMKQSFHYVQA